jgi:hypothetical protein
MSVKGRMGGEQPDHPSCSLRPHDQNVLPQCAQGRTVWLLPLRAMWGKMRRMGGWPVSLLCSRNARPQKALVGRAQWEAKQATLL